VTASGVVTHGRADSPGVLELVGGTLNGTMLEQGRFTWTGGWLGGRFTLTNGATATFSGAGDKWFDTGAEFHNYGTISWTGGRLIGYCRYGPASVLNHSNAVFHVAVDGTPFTRAYGDYPFHFVNQPAALLRKSSAGVVTVNSLSLNQQGEVRVEVGRLDLNTPVTLADGGRITGAGLVRQTGDTISLVGLLTLDGASFQTQAGTLASSGGGRIATLNNALWEWSGGWLNGTLTLTNGSSAAFSTTGDKWFNTGAQLHNYGAITWTAGRLIAYCRYGPVSVHNHEPGRFIATGSTTLIRDYANYSAAFTNDGTLFLGTPGALVSGDWQFVQSASGATELLLAGTTPGTQFGRWTTTGAGSLGGSLRASFAGNYRPLTDSAFPVLSANPLAGNFASVELPPLYSGLHWTVERTNNSVTLHALGQAACDSNCPPADLALTMSAAPQPGVIGSNLVFTLTVTNAGPGDAANVTLTDPLPSSVSLVSVVPSQGALTNFGQRVIAQLGALPVGASATVAITVTPTAFGLLTNTASVAAGEVDPDLTNNVASVTLMVEPPDQPVLFVNVSGADNTDGSNFFHTLLLAGARATCLNLATNGQAAALLATNTYDQVWVFDVSPGADDFSADWQAIADWFTNRTSQAVICDARSRASFVGERWQSEGRLLTENYYENLKREGGGLVLATGSSAEQGGLNSLNDRLGLQPFTGTFNLTRLPANAGNPLLSYPNNIGLDLPDDVAAGQAPFGLQPNGLILYGAAWHGGNDNTPGISSTIRGGSNFRIEIAMPGDGSQFNEEAPILFRAQPVEGLAPFTFQWSSDRDGALGTDREFTLTTLSPGAHTLTVLARDGLGSADSATAQITVLFVQPAIAITLQAGSDTGQSSSDRLTTNTTPTFDVTINKRGSVEVSCSGGAFTPALTNLEAGTYALTAPTLADGVRPVAVRFVPQRGNPVTNLITVTIDTQGPRVLSTIPAAGSSVNSSLGQVDFTFDSPMFAGTFTTADAALVGPAGPVTISGVSALASDRLRVGFPPQRLDGPYTLTIGSEIADAAGNFMDQNADGSNGVAGSDEFSIAWTLGLPDLAVLDLTAPVSGLAGQPVSVSWILTNQGVAAVTGSWKTRLQLATAADGTGASTLATFTATNSIPSGASLSVTGQVILPAGMAGQRWVRALADWDNTVFESVETNNSFLSAQSIELLAPDLEVSLLTSGATAQFGDSLPVTWAVRNAGTADAQANWSDRVYLSSQSNSISGATPLLAVAAGVSPLTSGASYTNTQPVTFPLTTSSTPGDFFFIVVTDTTGVQSESSEANNLRSTPITLTLPPRPDLAIEEVLAPDFARAGLPVELVWTVTNRGSLTLIDVAWTEAISLSNANGTVTALAEFRATNSLASGEWLNRTQTVVLPSSLLAGDVRFFVRADAHSQVVEENEANNVSFATNFTTLPAELTLTLARGEVNEDGAAYTGTVTRNGSRAAALEITLTNSHPSELAVTNLVVIPAGAGSVSFSLTPLLDGLIDGDHLVTIGASAADYAGASAAVVVRNIDVPQLALAFLVPTVPEGSAVMAIVSRDYALEQDLAVNLFTGDPAQMLSPVSVIIPSNQLSAVVSVFAADDLLIEGIVTNRLTASAAGFASASATVAILDNDSPSVVLTLTADRVSEGGGPLATRATLTRSPVTENPLVLVLVSSNTTKVRLPATAVIAENEASVSFPVATVDNQIVDGDTVVPLAVFIRASGSQVLIGQGTGAELTVLDDDGPTLRLDIARDVVGEGLNPATTASVTRNTPTTNALVVNLNSSDTTEVTVPDTVTIPVGATTASFLLSTPADSTPDGNRSARVTASAPGFTSGLDSVVVSDADLPDLSIASLTVPTNGFTDATFALGYRIENRGLAPAGPTVLTRFFLSRDPIVGGDTLLGDYTYSGTLNVGQFFEQTLQFRLPSVAGQYWIVVVTDAGGQVHELLEDNNTAVVAVPITVDSAYTATVQTATETAVIPTNVLFTGSAVRRGSSQPAAGVPVSVHVTVRGTRRIYSAYTDDSGNFSMPFWPLPNEAGNYSIGAAHPGDATAPVQDTFSLLGMKLSSTSVPVRVLEGTTVTGAVQVVNLGDAALNGLAAGIVGGVGNLNVNLSLSATSVGARGRVPLTYVISANDLSQLRTEVRLRVTSSEGPVAEGSLYVGLEPQRSRLVAFPDRLEAAMPIGGQQRVEFTVVNQGGATSGPVTVSVPNQPWLSVASTNPLPVLAPGDSNIVTLLLTPAADLSLGVYRGSVGASAADSAVTLPFEFLAVSEARGDLLVEAVDEFTYYAEGAPRITNALVTITDSITREVVTSGYTDATGHFFAPQIPEAFYNLQVTAPQHFTFRGTLRLSGGRTNTITAFLSRETVQYRWTVVPTTIEDRTRITIETTFETHVPVPVVTVSPAYVDLSEIVDDVSQITLEISNHGLVAAEDVEIQVEANDYWRVEPLANELGRLPALSSITVPLTITRLGQEPSGGEAKSVSAKDRSSGGGHGFLALVISKLVCPGKTNTDAKPVVFHDPDKSPAGTVGSGSGGDSGGPGAGVGGVVSGYLPEAIVRAPAWPSISSVNTNLDLDAHVTVPHAPSLVVCDCKKAKFQSVCYPVPLVGSVLEAAAGALKGAIDAVPGLDQVEIEPTSDIKICTCCDEGGIGTQFEADLGLDFKASLTVPLAGLPPLSGHVNIRGYDLEYSLSMGCALKADIELGGHITGKTDCHLTNLQVCASAHAGAAPLVVCELGGSVTLKRPGTNDLTIEATAAAGVRTCVSGELKYCLGQGFSGEISICPVTLFAGVSVVFPGLEPFQWEISKDVTTNLYYPPRPTNQELALIAKDADEKTLAAFGQLPGVKRAPSRAKSGPAGDGVCAQVKLRLDQDLVMTRNAFDATLELENRSQTSILEDIQVVVNITDTNGQPVNHLFGIRAPVVTGLGAVDGTGSLAPNATGSASWILVPTRDAAPLGPTLYGVGGLIMYKQDGREVTIPLYSAPITVYPDPLLVVKYFHERAVYSDDPFTPPIEPPVPFNLAVMIENRGLGMARDLRIISGQPRIIENERGLVIDFKIIGTEVAGRMRTPSLTANFGHLGPHQRAIGRWFFTSTLQGLFTEYSARWEHLDSLGKTNLSLIDEVTIHEMIHLVQAQGAFEDGRPDFLVNGVPDSQDLPDTLYLSDGTTNTVQYVNERSLDAPPGPTHLTVQLTSPMPAGWAYLRIFEPSDGAYRLRRVVRSDGMEMYMNTNVWITDRTFLGAGLRPLKQNILHLLDYDSPGAYTLYYELLPEADITAPSSTMAALPAASYEQFNVSWTGTDGPDGSGLASFDVFVSVNGGAFTPWLQRTTLRGSVYQGTLGNTYAFYTLATDTDGNREEAPGEPDAQTAVNLVNVAPALTAAGPIAVNEGTTVLITNLATDADAPAQSLTFSLAPGAPAGATINPSSGLISWPTAEASGPSTNQLTVIVRDNGTPSLSATNAVTVVVNEVNARPTLTLPPSLTVNEGQIVTFTNRATDADLPAQALTFTLGEGAPAGAGVHPSSGVFTWHPAEFQGGTTNRLAIIVTDNATPTLSATQNFTVIVRDTRPDFTLSVGTTNLFAGESSFVPLRLNAGTDLTNVSWLIETDFACLTNFSLQSLAPQVAVTEVRLGSNQLALRCESWPGAALQGQFQLARLAFDALPVEHSAIVPLRASALTGGRDGTPPALRGAVISGRVFLVGREPLLDAALATNGARWFTLYGQMGRRYVIEASTNLLLPDGWGEVSLVQLSAPHEIVGPVAPVAPAVFYRAREVAGLALSIQQQAGTVFIEWPSACADCRLEETAQLGSGTNWTRCAVQPVLRDGKYGVELPHAGTARFFRLAGPGASPLPLTKP
ncbi:MAG: DUF11 domain-containing protein, partial [Verrucomicrobia bacterium]|nr:DUF11 domain-containing protein [Verrucomicrobiota bacterium]